MCHATEIKRITVKSCRCSLWQNFYLSLFIGNTFPFLSCSSCTKGNRWYKNFLHFSKKPWRDFSFNPRYLLKLRSSQSKLLWMFLLTISAAQKILCQKNIASVMTIFTMSWHNLLLFHSEAAVDFTQTREWEVISLCSIYKKNQNGYNLI